MALAGIVEGSNREYRDFYTQAWPPRNQFRLLDNGAWEDTALPDYQLIRIAQSCDANEIMAPDVINDAVQTWDRTTKFLAGIEAHYRMTRPPNIAAIAHGSSLHEAMAFVGAIERLTPKVQTIAIGRAYSRNIGNPTARYELALSIKERYGNRFGIHLLGFSDEWPTELKHCASFPGLIRSCDTIAPFSYAFYGYSIEQAGKVEVPRPADYFSLGLDRFDHDLVQDNIAALDAMARTSIFSGRF
jgi:hypothetical protein